MSVKRRGRSTARTKRKGQGAAPARARPAGARNSIAGNTLEVLNGIRRLDRGLRLAAREVQRFTGLSAAQLFVLEKLLASPATSVGELAERTMTDRSSVSVIVDRLVVAGLAKRLSSREDRRRAEVRITPAGRAILKRAPQAPADLLLTGLRRLPPASVRRLAATLAELNAILGYRDAQMLFAETE